MCDQMAALQAERSRLEDRLAVAERMEEKLQLKEKEEATLRGEIQLLQQDMEASRRSHALIMQQQNEEALETVALLKKVRSTTEAQSNRQMTMSCYPREPMK